MTTTMKTLSSIEVVNTAVPVDYDNGSVSYPSTTQEIYRFYEGAVLLRTITINYTDITKANIDTWTIVNGA